MSAECQECGKESSGLLTYSEFEKIQSCKIKEGDIYRESMEPIFKKEIELCYICYRARVKKDRNRDATSS